MRPSWIRRWFMKHDDGILWCFFVIITGTQITAALVLLDLLVGALY